MKEQKSIHGIIMAIMICFVIFACSDVPHVIHSTGSSANDNNWVEPEYKPPEQESEDNDNDTEPEVPVVPDTVYVPKTKVLNPYYEPSRFTTAVPFSKTAVLTEFEANNDFPKSMLESTDFDGDGFDEIVVQTRAQDAIGSINANLYVYFTGPDHDYLYSSTVYDSNGNAQLEPAISYYEYECTCCNASNNICDCNTNSANYNRGCDCNCFAENGFGNVPYSFTCDISGDGVRDVVRAYTDGNVNYMRTSFVASMSVGNFNHKYGTYSNIYMTFKNENNLGVLTGTKTYDKASDLLFAGKFSTMSSCSIMMLDDFPGAADEIPLVAVYDPGSESIQNLAEWGSEKLVTPSATSSSAALGCNASDPNVYLLNKSLYVVRDFNNDGKDDVAYVGTDGTTVYVMYALFDPIQQLVRFALPQPLATLSDTCDITNCKLLAGHFKCKNTWDLAHVKISAFASGNVGVEKIWIVPSVIDDYSLVFQTPELWYEDVQKTRLEIDAAANVCTIQYNILAGRFRNENFQYSGDTSDHSCTQVFVNSPASGKTYVMSPKHRAAFGFSDDISLGMVETADSTPVFLRADLDNSSRDGVLVLNTGTPTAVNYIRVTNTSLQPVFSAAPTLLSWMDDFYVENSTQYWYRTGDFNGDGTSDLGKIDFTRNRNNLTVIYPSQSQQTFILASNSTSVQDANMNYVGGFRFNQGIDQDLYTGDFNGDGVTDFMRVEIAINDETTAPVYVALSTAEQTSDINGMVFTESEFAWLDDFLHEGELAAVGDFDGDGRDDIAEVTSGSTGFTNKVRVALSKGSSFGSLSDWLQFETLTLESNAGPTVPDDFLKSGDFNCDGKDDLVIFKNNGSGVWSIYVALSTGSSFETEQEWHANALASMHEADSTDQDIKNYILIGNFRGHGCRDSILKFVHTDSTDDKFDVYMMY